MKNCSIEPASLDHRIERPNERGRRRTHDRQQRLDRVQHTGDASKRQPRRTECYDLAIRSGLVPSDDVNRVARGVHVIERAIQIFKGRSQFSQGA
jgi:hypothetical protein